MKNIKPFFIGVILALGMSSLAAWAATFNLFQPAAGILKGNPRTYVTTAAVSADVVSMWTGTCNAATFLRGDGTCVAPVTGAGGADTQVQFNAAGAFGGDAGLTYNAGTDTLTAGLLVSPSLTAAADQTVGPTSANSLTLQTNGASRLSIGSTGAWTVGGGVGTNGQVLTSSGAGAVPTWTTVSGGGSGANPTATIGLTAVNGSAGTFTRSDGAPALSQAIAPTWTQPHIFANKASVGPTAPLASTTFSILDAGSGFNFMGACSNGLASGSRCWNNRIGASAEWQLNAATDAGDSTGTAGVTVNRFGRTTLFGTGSSERLRILGADGAGDGYLTFYDSTGTTRRGYIGMGNTSGDDIYMVADGTANVIISTTAPGTAQVNGSAVCTANGTNCSETTTVPSINVVGCTTTPTVGIVVTRTGSIVSMRMDAVEGCTSNSSGFSLSGAPIPAGYRPLTTIDGCGSSALNNGVATTGFFEVGPSGTITFRRSEGSWANSNTKSIGLSSAVCTWTTR